MTFTEIQSRVAERLGIPSTATDSLARIGRSINDVYREVTSSLNIPLARRTVAVQASTAIGYATVTFTGVEKLERVYDDNDGSVRMLTEVSFDQLRNENPSATDTAETYAIESTTGTSVTIRLNAVAQSIYTLKADGRATVSDLSGSDVPAFAVSFHDVLVYGALVSEYRKSEKKALKDDVESKYERRLSQLRLDIARSTSLSIRQGMKDSGAASASGGSTGGSANSGGESYVQTGLITFDRDPAAPFAVTSGSAVVPNLDADKLDGLDSTDFVLAPASSTDNAIARYDGTSGNVQDSGITIADGASGTLSGSNSGDVTLSGSPNYLTIAGQVITRALIDLASHITGRLPYANLVAATAASRLIGRRSGSSGDFEEVTVGTGLSMSSGATLSTTPPGSDTQVVFNDGGAFAGDAGMVYDKTNDVLTLAGALKVGTNPASAGAIRLANEGTIVGRNASNSGNLTAIYVANDNTVRLGDASAVTTFVMSPSLNLLNGQLVFPATQNASSDANTLDDYEEGTWTPSVGGSATYTDRSGTYTKIGRIVTINGNIVINTIGTGSTGQITGVPFSSPTVYSGSVGYFFGAATNKTWVGCYINGSTISITGLTAAGTAADNPTVFFQNGSNIFFTITYFV